MPTETSTVQHRYATGLISFEPDQLDVRIDGARLRLEPGQTVIPHGVDCDLRTDEIAPRQT